MGRGGDWYDNVKQLYDHIYSKRFDLKTLQKLSKNWFDDVKVKAGLCMFIQSNIKQFLHKDQIVDVARSLTLI